jgi:glucosamine kinase
VSVLLAVDGGQTALRMAVVEGCVPGRVVEVGGFTHATGDESLAVAAAVSDAVAALELDGGVTRICLGLTAAPATQELRSQLAGLLAERLGGAHVALGPDMVTAHAGALDGAPGVVVAAGTGAVVLGLGADGTAHRADGLGYMLGDDGSGFAIARAGLRAALRAHERRGPATALQESAAAFFGPLDELPSRVRTSTSPVAAVASFTPQVAAAARAGDEVAARIWREAAGSLVETTIAVVRRVFRDASAASVAVSHAGRLFDAQDLLLEPFKRELAERCAEARHVEPIGDPLAGAARLVDRGLGPYASLMYATEGWAA